MAPSGDALGLVARTDVRTRWRALLGLALLVALAGAVTLGALAGARRTSSALDRFVDETQARDARIVVPDGGPGATALDDALEDEPWVEASAPMARLAFATGAGSAISVAASDDPAFTTSVDRPLVVEGRMPLPGQAHEIAVDEQLIRQEDLAVGDQLEVRLFEPTNFACALAQTCVLQLPEDAPETLVVTGVFRDVDALLSREFSPEGVATPAFFAEYGDRTGSFGGELLVRLRDGAADVERLEAAVEDVDPGALVLPAAGDYAEFPQDAVDVVGTALLVFAVLSAAAGSVVVAQAVSRHAAAGREHAQPLRSLGFTRAQQAAGTALPVAAAGAVGALLAAVLAAPTSTWFPFGGAARVEPEPGGRFDLVTLGVGAATIAAAVAAWAAWSAWRQAAPLPNRPPHPTALPRLLARAGADPAVIGGARLAFERPVGRGTTMLRSALAATTIGVVGALAAGVVLTSLDELVDDPARWGWNWDAVATPLDPSVVDTTAEALAAEDGVDGVAVYRVGQVDVAGEAIAAHTLGGAVGVGLTLVDGRAPHDDDEIGLGLLSRRALGVEVGDRVTVTGRGDRSRELEVVGTPVFPTFQDRDPGLGALLTAPAWRELSVSGGTVELVVRYDPGVDRDDLEGALSLEHALGFRHAAPPVRLDNLERSRGVGPALAGFFAVLGVLGLLHALVTAVRERRAMLAMLRLLGSRKAHIRRAVLWESLFVTGTSLLVGLPVGVAVGRWAWFRMVEDLGVVDPPRVEVAHVLLMVPVALGLALVSAAVPAWLAARRSIALELRAA